MGTEISRSKNMAEHQSFHLSSVHTKKKQNKLTAKNFKANVIEEQAKAIEELIATLTKNHTCQMETLIKSTTNAMKEFFVPRQE
jgi:hypothetical protein